MQFYDKSRRLANLSARISRVQRLIAERPDDERLLIALSGLAKRAEMARSAFAEITEETSFEVLDYRIVQIDDNYPLRSIADSLGDFQNAITAVYDSTINGPKAKAKYSEKIHAEATLNFEFFYPGSKGFIFSVPSETSLFGGSLDRTAEAFRDYVNVSSSDEARDATRVLGLAAISTLYRWVATNVRWGNSVNYEWKARKERLTGQHITSEKFALLEEVFRTAEDLEQEKIVRNGVLVGLDVAKRTFHFVEPDGLSFRGKLHSDFPTEERTVPGNYTAAILSSLRRTPATGEEKESFELISLT